MILGTEGFKRTAKSITIILLALLITAGSPSQVRAATTHYGANQWMGILTNSDTSFNTWGCDADTSDGIDGTGRLMCNGIPAGVNNKATFIAIYHDMLYAPNGSNAQTTGNGGTQNQRVAAFTILSMMGVARSNWTGEATAIARVNKAISLASDNYAAWAALVASYDAAGRVDYNTPFDYSTENTNTAYRQSDSGEYDVLWHLQGGKDPSVVFTLPSGKHVAIKRACGNLVGNNATLEKINNWTLSASSTAKVGGVDVTSAKPGDQIQWTHQLKNDGPDATAASVHSNLALTGFSNGWGAGPGEWSEGDTGAGAAVGVMRVLNSYATYTVSQADVGNTLCETVQYDQKSGVDATDGKGNDSCVSIPYNYTLTPLISTNISGVVEPNASIQVTPSATNSGPTKSQDTQWQITQMIVLPTKDLINQGGGSSASGPCGSYYGASPNVTCKTIKTGNTVFDEAGTRLSGDVLSAETVVVDDLEAGTEVCFAFSVQPYSSGSSNWYNSIPICLIVGKKPKIQVHGGDLSVGKAFVTAPLPLGRVQTSVSTKINGPAKNTFGSWIEYGIFATGTIKGAASGSAYAGALGMVNGDLCAPNRLSFANAASAGDVTCGTLGKYTSAKLIPNVLASFATAGTPLSTPGAVVVNNLLATNGTYIGTYAGNITLNPSTLAPGKSVILKVGGTVTIAGDQIYNPDNNGAKYAHVAELPQLVIIADKIVINDIVTKVDAWLIANGTHGIIETCNINSSSYVLVDPAQKLTSTKCAAPLTINGPVMAKQLWLRRTGGSGVGVAAGDPAEVFNLRPDAYLWATTRATGDGRVQTVYTTELPPRL